MADHAVTRIAVTFDLLDQPFKVPRELGSGYCNFAALRASSRTDKALSAATLVFVQ
jgi:hypothetical protein